MCVCGGGGCVHPRSFRMWGFLGERTSGQAERKRPLSLLVKTGTVLGRRGSKDGAGGSTVSESLPGPPRRNLYTGGGAANPSTITSPHTCAGIN